VSQATNAALDHHIASGNFDGIMDEFRNGGAILFKRDLAEILELVGEEMKTPEVVVSAGDELMQRARDGYLELRKSNRLNFETLSQLAGTYELGRDLKVAGENALKRDDNGEAPQILIGEAPETTGEA
jgi:hypothetical protein